MLYKAPGSLKAGTPKGTNMHRTARTLSATIAVALTLLLTVTWTLSARPGPLPAEYAANQTVPPVPTPKAATITATTSTYAGVSHSGWRDSIELLLAQIMTLTLEQWLGILAGVLAVYGAVLSTVVAIKQLRSEWKHVSVTLRTTFPTYGTLGRDPDFGQEAIAITVVNSGMRPVTITSMGFTTNSGLNVLVMDDAFTHYPLPASLTQSQRVAVNASLEELITVLLKGRQKDPNFKFVNAYATDSEDRRYVAKMHRNLQQRLEKSVSRAIGLEP